MRQRHFRAGLLACALVAALVCTGAQPAEADDYPSRPITLIVPYPPGGGVDTMGRITAQKLTAALGQRKVRRVSGQPDAQPCGIERPQSLPEQPSQNA